MLVEVAARVQQVLGSSGSVARFGGDEFALYLPEGTRDAALQMARRISDAIEQPIQVGDSPLAVGASIGLCDCTVHAEEVGEAISHAGYGDVCGQAGAWGTCRVHARQ